MLRRLVSATAWLIPIAAVVSVAALMAGTGLVTAHPPVLAQATIQFDEGDSIGRFVKEDTAAGGSVGPPVAASGGTGLLAYSLSGKDAASFTINASTGQIYLGQNTALDYESGKTTYRLVVTATDQPGQRASVDVTVTLEDVNEPPVFAVGKIPSKTFEVKENSPADSNIGDPFTAIDPENDDVTYSLAGTDAGLFAIDASSGQVRTRGPLNFEAKSSYVLRVNASDVNGSGRSTGVNLTIRVTDVNTEAPGTPDKPSVAPDPEYGHEALVVAWNAPENVGPTITGYVVQYRVEGSGEAWKQVSVDRNSLETTISGLESDTEYEAQVRAVNDEGEGKWSVSGKGVTYSAQPVNSPPEFDWNGAATLMVPENAQPGTGVGSPFGASDSDPQDTLVYSLAGPDAGAFNINDSTGQVAVGPGVSLDHEVPADSNGDNVYGMTVRVTDGKDERGNADSAVDDSIELTIRVTNVNEPPEFPSSTRELEGDENSTASLASLVAVDPEGQAVTWNLDPASPDGGSFSLSGSGTLVFKVAPDYESPLDTDRDNDYELVVVASDAGPPALSSSMSLTVRVVNIDEPGTVSLSTLGPQVGVEIMADLADPDGGVTGASWQWLRYSGGQERAIQGAKDPVYTPTAADVGSRIQATVNYADLQGPGKYGVGPLTHPVGDSSNSPPEFSGEPYSRQVVENTAPGINIGGPVTATDPDQDALTYSLSGIDAGVFEIDATDGQIKTKDPVDYERRAQFQLTVKATDPGGLSATAQVVVTVTDVDTEAPGRPDAPTVKPNWVDPVNSIDVEWREPSNTGPEITGYVVRYRAKDAGESWTQVPVAGRALKTTVSGLRTDTAYEAQVNAYNDEGTGQWSESGIGSTLAFAPANAPPEFDRAGITLSVDENVPAGGIIGEPVVATDLDNDELAYSLTGDDSGKFVVDPATGQLRAAAGIDFDYESPSDSNGGNVYSLTIQVTDGLDGDGNADNSVDDEIGVTVVIKDVNESPEFPSLAVELEIYENTPANVHVGDPITATDPDSDELTYSLGGVDAGSFVIEAVTGQVLTLGQIDYESQKVFRVTVIAADDGNLRAQVAVNIRVLNINEAPVLETALPDRTLVESGDADQFDLSVHFSDPDGDRLNYRVTSSDSNAVRVGLVGTTLTLTPIAIGSATVRLTAADPGGLSVQDGFLVEVVTTPGGPGGGSFPIFPIPPQGTGDPSETDADLADLLSENPVIVVPANALLAPGQTVVLGTIAFNMLGDPLPASAVEVVCTWGSDGGGSFNPNGTETACSTTFTAPADGSGTITVRVTQAGTLATGTGIFEVATDLDSAPGVVEEEIPEVPFPDGVTGSVVTRANGGSIASPNGLTMYVPPGAIGDDHLGAYIEELSPSGINVPTEAGYTVGSHAGNFGFTDLAGNPIPGYRTSLPVRICLPITPEDLGTAVGGYSGVYVVHMPSGGQTVHHLPDNDVATTMACANIDRFSLYLVGLAVGPGLPGPAEASEQLPSETQTPTPGPSPTPDDATEPTPTPPPGESTPEAIPEMTANRDPVLLPTPVLPHTGDRAPGPRLLLVAALAATALLTAGVIFRLRAWDRR